VTSGCVLAIDQGTSGTKALIVRADGSVASAAEVPVGLRPVGAEGAETDPAEIWDSMLVAAHRAIEAAGERPVAVALANQGETVLAWDRSTGTPRSPAISWQDRRSAGICARLAGHGPEIRRVTGLELDPYFSAPKMVWLREQAGAEGVITTTDTWLLSRLAGAFATDAATASRTLLLDLDTVTWSERMCALFRIDPASLPEILDNDATVGSTAEFGGELPVAGIAVDQQAALLAEGCLGPAQAKCTFGTGAFLLATVGEHPVRSRAGLVSCVAWRLGGASTYCLDGQVYTAGTAIDWLARMGIVASPSELDPLAGPAILSGEAFVPAFTGLAAPYWAPAARASLTGLSLASDRGTVVRAVLEGIAANVAVLAQATADDLGAPLRRLRADGGLTRSRVLMQAQADLLQKPVDVYATPHATALGVAALARLALGDAATVAEAVAAWAPATTYWPACGPEEAADRLSRWRRAVAAALRSVAAPAPVTSTGAAG
jgi:glycerol kinase